MKKLFFTFAILFWFFTPVFAQEGVLFKINEVKGFALKKVMGNKEVKEMILNTSACPGTFHKDTGVTCFPPQGKYFPFMLVLLPPGEFEEFLRGADLWNRGSDATLMVYDPQDYFTPGGSKTNFIITSQLWFWQAESEIIAQVLVENFKRRSKTKI